MSYRLVLKGDRKGNFNPLSILESGIYISGNGKALVKFLDNKALQSKIIPLRKVDMHYLSVRSQVIK